MTSASLWDQIERGDRPAAQKMDFQTLIRIGCEIKTRLLASSDQRPLIPDLELANSTVAGLFPSDDLFFRPHNAEGIHGRNHAARVAVNAMILGELSPRIRADLVAAAFYHDLCRANDNDDPGHGARAAARFRDRLPELASKMIVHHEARDIDKSDPDYDALGTFQAADALDRCRLPNTNWWLKRDRLVLPHLSFLWGFSARLTFFHEAGCLLGEQPEDALIRGVYLASVEPINESARKIETIMAQLDAAHRLSA